MDEPRCGRGDLENKRLMKMEWRREDVEVHAYFYTVKLTRFILFLLKKTAVAALQRHKDIPDGINFINVRLSKLAKAQKRSIYRRY